GVSGAAANSGFTPLLAYALTVDPAAPSTIYVGGAPGIFKSVDGGKSWTPASNNLPVPVWSLLFVPGSSEILAGTSFGFFGSTDGGVTWTQRGSLAPTYAFAIDPNSPSTIYAVGVGGELPSGQQVGAVGRSTDGAMTWEFYGGDTGTFPPVFNAAVVNPPSSSSPLLMGSDAGIWGTRVGGQGGLHLLTNGALASRVVFALAEDPVSRSIVYAGTDGGLFKSTDG